MRLLALFIIRATGAYQFQAVSGAAPLLVAAGYDYAQIGLLIGAYMLPGILVTVPAGMLSRGYGDKVVLAGAGLMAAMSGFGWLLAGRMLSGAGDLAVLMLVIKMTADRYAGPFLATATAVVITSWYVGFAAALVGSAWLASLGSRRVALVASGLPALLGLAMLPFVGQPQPAPPLVPGAPPEGRVSWRFTTSASLCWSLTNIGLAVLVAFLPGFLVASGWDPVAAGARASVLSWSAGAAAILGEYVADRLLERTLAVILGASACAVCAALLPPLQGALALLIAAGLTFALFPAVLTAQVGEATPPAQRSLVLGWYSGASYAGLAVFPWIAGCGATRQNPPPHHLPGSRDICRVSSCLRMVLRRGAPPGADLIPCPTKVPTEVTNALMIQRGRLVKTARGLCVCRLSWGMPRPRHRRQGWNLMVSNSSIVPA
ncbi:MAG: MFS transporter [Acetobacteraceae bacterium]|nr:MFS transporter [Acetobacteraceae bacterium]MSP29717.1 MFS transporter [Acetobacteraceae bacterium]